MEPQAVWQEFTGKLRSGELTERDCKSINGRCYGLLLSQPEREPLKRAILATAAPAWERGEELLIARVDLGDGYEVRLDFALEGSGWQLVMVDGVTISIPELDSLPFADFPPAPLDESFLRAEANVTFQIRAYNQVKENQGRAAALGLLRDGKGRKTCAAAWMPYFAPHKSLVVLLAWYEARLHGEEVSIEAFSDDLCALKLTDCTWFRLYDITGHLREMISLEEYREVFEAIWRDRGQESGWSVDFEYDGYDTTVRFCR